MNNIPLITLKPNSTEIVKIQTGWFGWGDRREAFFVWDEGPIWDGNPGGILRSLVGTPVSTNVQATIFNNELIVSGFGRMQNFNPGITIINSITNMIIGDVITEINNQQFPNHLNLTSLRIGNQVTRIGNHAFRNCPVLTSVTFGNNVRTIWNNSFEICISLTSVTFPNSLVELGSAVFWGCTGLTSIVIPNNVTTIGTSCFGNCPSLTSITIGSSIVSVGGSSFNIGVGVPSVLQTVTILRPQPPVINNTVFQNRPLQNVILQVPRGSLSLYQNAVGWRDFGIIQEL